MTAPVQDDDAEWLRQLDGQFTLETRQRLERIASRRSPTPDTGLIEALEKCATALNSFIYIIAHRFDGDGSYYWMREPTHEEAQAAMEANNNAHTALANAAPAQVESGK